MSKSFKINCYFPNYKLTSICVYEENTIENLMNLFKNEFVFIFNGIELQPSMTLRFYDACPGSPFIAVPKGDKEKRNRWLQMGEKEKDIIGKLTGTAAIAKEKMSCQMNDLKFLKLELKGKKYNKEMTRLLNQLNSTKPKQNKPTKTVYTKPESPAKDPLPVFW